MHKEIIADIERLKEQGKTTEQIADIIFDKYGLFEHVTQCLMMFAT